MWGQTLYGSGWATGQDREFGTLEPTIQSPTPYLYVVLGRIVWNVAAGLIGGLIVYVVVVVAAGRPPALPDPVAFVVLFLFVMVTLSSVGIVFAAAYVYTRYAGFIQNIGEFAFYVGTGCMFPVVLLPFWTNPIALIFPPTWALDALRYFSIPGYVGFGWGLQWDLVGAVRHRRSTPWSRGHLPPRGASTCSRSGTSPTTQVRATMPMISRRAPPDLLGARSGPTRSWRPRPPSGSCGSTSSWVRSSSFRSRRWSFFALVVDVGAAEARGDFLHGGR